uniref:Uncharacterized protein n=1 Tax=Setaria italica TaxID=4555 RepID=K4ADU2_SETIT
MGMDGGIPGTSGEFLRRVSSRAYGMRRHLMESLDSLAYDVLETNPWREDSKPVYVLARSDNHLWTMKTRRSRNEVERELGMLFSKGGGSGVGTKSKYSGSKFNMVVEDIREGVLVSSCLKGVHVWDMFLAGNLPFFLFFCLTSTVTCLVHNLHAPFLTYASLGWYLAKIKTSTLLVNTLLNSNINMLLVW